MKKKSPRRKQHKLEKIARRRQRQTAAKKLKKLRKNNKFDRGGPIDVEETNRCLSENVEEIDRRLSESRDRYHSQVRSIQAGLSVGLDQAIRKERKVTIAIIVSAFVGISLLVLPFILLLRSCSQQTVVARKQLAAMSNADHGATLEEFMANARGEYEVCYALFDGNDQKLFEYMDKYIQDEPDWPEADRFFNLARAAGAKIEAHWHSRISGPTSINDDFYVSAQLNPKKSIIMEYDSDYYFTPSEKGWPSVSEIVNFKRRNSRIPLHRRGDYYEEFLEHFDIQCEIVPLG